MDDRGTRETRTCKRCGWTEECRRVTFRETFVHCRLGREQLIKYFHRSAYGKIVVARIVGDRRFCGKENRGTVLSPYTRRTCGHRAIFVKNVPSYKTKVDVYRFVIRQKIMRTDLRKDKEVFEGSCREGKNSWKSSWDLCTLRIHYEKKISLLYLSIYAVLVV